MRSSKVAVLLVITLGSVLLTAQSVNVTTWHNDIGRTCQNTSETTLTPTTVNKTGFGKVCSYSVDGQVYAQPLVVTGLSIGGGHPVVYVVTLNDSVYAFDGTNCTLLLGPKSLLQGSEVAVQCGDVGGCGCQTVNPSIGILGTPVIDTSTNTMYLVSWAEVQGAPPHCNNPANTFTHRVHALDITTLNAQNEKFNGPVAISATVGTLSFTSVDHIQRPGLLLLPGSPPVVYAAFSEMDGALGLPNGWVLGYNASNLTDSGYPKAFPTATTVNSHGVANGGGGVWQGGAGLAAGADSSGTTYIYFGTGNGVYGVYNGLSNWGDSFLKLKTDLSSVQSSFTPFDQFCRNCSNMDFGAGGVTLIPDNTLSSPYAYLAVMADKSGSIWVMDRTSPGGFNGSNTRGCPSTCSGTNANLETIPGTLGYHNSPAYWNSNLYYAAIGGSLTRYTVASSCSEFTSVPPVCAPGSGPPIPGAPSVTFPYGATPSVSANGNSGGIVWAIWQDGSAFQGQNARLYALSSDLSTDLYDTTMCTNDALNPGTKFSVPTAANGYVYLGTQDSTGSQGTFYIFGLVQNKTC